MSLDSPATKAAAQGTMHRPQPFRMGRETVDPQPGNGCGAVSAASAPAHAPMPLALLTSDSVQGAQHAVDAAGRAQGPSPGGTGSARCGACPQATVEVCADGGAECGSVALPTHSTPTSAASTPVPTNGAMQVRTVLGDVVFF